VVIHNLHIVRLTLDPAKDDSPLVVDANAVESRPITLEQLKPIPGRRPKIQQGMDSVQEVELAYRCLNHRWWISTKPI
jgi:hypothetical protein